MLVFLVLLFSVNLFGEKVKKILIEGNINVKESVIFEQIKTKKGTVLSEETLSEDIKSIFNLGFFDDVAVRVDTSTWKVIFVVKEKPYIKKIDFRGNIRYSNSSLKRKISTKEKEYLNESKLKEDIEKISNFYKDKGYADVKVNYQTEIIDERKNYCKVNLDIQEGKKYLLKEIQVFGVKKYPPKKIYKIMKSKKNKPYKETSINSDIEEIKKFYISQGYPKIEINLTKELIDEYVTIKLNISEGERFKIKEIKFEGNTVYSSKELLKVLTIKKNEIFIEEKIQASITNIQDLYGNKGYIRSKISYEVKYFPYKNLVDIIFNIIENNIVYVNKIYIDGCKVTKEYVVKRELVLKEGEPVSTYKIRRSMERIFNLGFLEDVNVNFHEIGNPNKLDLTFIVSEGRPGMLSMGAGYSTLDEFFGTLQVSHLNLFGRGQRLDILWEFGARKMNYQISWTEPWVFNKPLSLGFNVYDLTRLRDYGAHYGAYKERRIGADVKVGPKLGEYWSLLFTYSYETVNYIDVLEELKQTLISPGVISSLTSQLICDTRDYIFDPSKGSRNSLSVQYAGLGGDVYFVKSIVRSSWFFPTFWKFVLALNATLGNSWEILGYKVPVSEKFYVGGADTVRGYLYRDIGPSEGGNTMFVGNVEYRFPIVIEKKKTLVQGVIFYDVGNAWRKLDELDFNIGIEDARLKSGVGFGIRFTTPVFPVRLDWAWALNPKPGTSPFQFYFSLWQMF